MRSSHGSSVRPLTWAQPVMPGLDGQAPALALGVAASTWTGTVGRGPTIAMSPRRTLTRLGSSSSDVRRSSARRA